MVGDINRRFGRAIQIVQRCRDQRLIAGGEVAGQRFTATEYALQAVAALIRT